MASSHSYSLYLSNYSYYVRYSWNVISQDYINLTSTIHWEIAVVNSSGSDQTNYYALGSITLDDQETTWSKFITFPKGSSVVVASGNTTVRHNSDGTKINMPFRYYAADGRGDDDYSGTITLDALRQYALIKYVKTGAGLSTLYDENNYAITYDNPAQGQVTSLQVGISRYSSGDSDMIVDYRTVSPYSTAYTLSLTDDEWQRLYSYYSGSTSMGFYFLIKTVIGSKTYVRPFSTTIYLKNHSPTLNPTVVAVHNSDHYNLTGSDKTLIKYMSDAQYEINAAAVKGAVIKEQFVRNGDTYYEPSGVISAVESNTFYFGATDTRGTVVNSAIIFNNLADLKWVEYVKLTTNIKDIQFNADGSLTVTASGKYFSGNFGQADNKLTIDYEVHQVNDVDGDWQTLGFVTPSVDSNNNYTYSFTITGLDYQKRYAVSIKANDELMTTDVVSKTIASTPVFDWGENDFNFNVPVNMTDGYVYPQKLLWGNPDSLTTYSQLGDNETVTLDEPISSQPTGIVLVFSLYRNNAVEDVSINSFFVSKAEVVHLLGGAPHLFMMGINSNLSVFGSKYIYIEDSRLTGFSGNTAASTAACGITFNNNQFVLRYVIGV